MDFASFTLEGMASNPIQLASIPPPEPIAPAPTREEIQRRLDFVPASENRELLRQEQTHPDDPYGPEIGPAEPPRRTPRRPAPAQPK